MIYINSIIRNPNAIMPNMRQKKNIFSSKSKFIFPPEFAIIGKGSLHHKIYPQHNVMLFTGMGSETLYLQNYEV
jgi:hypothetical protein